MLDLQSYDEVLDFLEVLFQKNILEPKYIQEMNFILDGCRKEKMVAIRAIDSCFMEYRQKNQDYRGPTPEEQEIWKQLFNVWQ
ncbi:hypothetical protein [Enterobacter ludwigii]|uniref:hypothetical protein n=1 Tax=Enterobacter ludwigii TaxID=299767 RepID=UPI001CC18A52|nr:hypothetical protein [Enterobacter ludwigii]UAK92386.1 hypothetical protein K8P07_09760 [Enterobacter ludwigii]UBH88346.1 hypothetical protein LA317_15855 [Enterobacter ludwigii]